MVFKPVFFLNCTNKKHLFVVDLGASSKTLFMTEFGLISKAGIGLGHEDV